MSETAVHEGCEKTATLRVSLGRCGMKLAYGFFYELTSPIVLAWGCRPRADELISLLDLGFRATRSR